MFQGYTVFSIPVGVLYRPNEAKVKNLQAKNYLGKARLVATSDQNNTSTGFQGLERKLALAAELVPKDDRPPENISFAATNLVQKGLSSRNAREQSAPPTMNRNMFPPTPPPESDKPMMGRSITPGGMTGRAASVRNPPSKSTLQQPNGAAVTMDVPADRPNMFSRSNTIDSLRSASPARGASADRTELRSPPRGGRPRIGTTRTASESRVPSRKGYGERQRPPLFRETTPKRAFETIQEGSVNDNIYDMYQTPRSDRPPPRYAAEPRFSNGSDEYMEDYSWEDGNRIDLAAFELIGNAPGQGAPPLARSSSKRPAVRSLRVKVHTEDDTRYMMFGPTIEYGDFEGKIREKFSIKSRMKIKMQDEGDMITMGDQDDLDMLLSLAISAAGKEGNEMGKLEVSVPP